MVKPGSANHSHCWSICPVRILSLHMEAAPAVQVAVKTKLS